MVASSFAEVPARLAAALEGEHPLFIYRGDTKAWRWRLWADDQRTVPYDLSGVTGVAAQIRRSPDDLRKTDLACEVELPNVIVMHLHAQASASCPSGRWDLQLTWPDGRVLTAIKGPVYVEPDVTRHE
jgi:hypothetical protein